MYLLPQDEPYKCLVCARSFSESEQMHAHLLTHNGQHDGSRSLLPFDSKAPQNITNYRQVCPSSPPLIASKRNHSTAILVNPEYTRRVPLATEVNSLACKTEDVCSVSQNVFPSYDISGVPDLGKPCQQSERASDDGIKSSNGSEMNGNDERIVKPKAYEHCDGDSGVEEEEMIDVESC